MQYVRVGTHKLGVLTDKEVLKLDIALEWHKLNEIQREKELAKEIKSEEFQSMIDYINKDFKQNYTE
jgi:hypothetical protein